MSSRLKAELQTTFMNLSDIRHLFDYTEWANDLAMEAADDLPDEDLLRDFGISHKSIFGTLLHMAGAEWIWLERWHGRSPAKPQAWSMWTPESCADLAALNDRWMEVIERRGQFVSGLDEARRGITIQTSERRSELNAPGRSNAARRQSRDNASWPGRRHDPAARHRTAVDRFVVLSAQGYFAEVIVSEARASARATRGTSSPELGE